MIEQKVSTFLSRNADEKWGIFYMGNFCSVSPALVYKTKSSAKRQLVEHARPWGSDEKIKKDYKEAIDSMIEKQLIIIKEIG